MTTRTPPHDLNDLQARIAALHTERSKRQALPRDQSEAVAEINTFVASAAASFAERLRYAAVTGLLSGAFEIQAGPNGRVDLAPLLAAVVGPEALAAALVRYVGELPTAEDSAKNAVRLAEINRELDELEELEEQLITAAEAQGLHASRRAGARPEIVLKLRT